MVFYENASLTGDVSGKGITTTRSITRFWWASEKRHDVIDVGIVILDWLSKLTVSNVSFLYEHQITLTHNIVYPGC
jgi:hypothetical protein